MLLRRSLAATAPVREALVLGEDRVLAETVEHENLRHQCCLVKARHEGKRQATPASVAQLEMKAFILQCEAPTVAVAPLIAELLSGKVPGLLWGHQPHRVRALAEQLGDETDSRYHLLKVVVHTTLPTTTGSLLYPETLVAIVGPASQIPSQVRPPSPALAHCVHRFPLLPSPWVSAFACTAQRRPIRSSLSL